MRENIPSNMRGGDEGENAGSSPPSVEIREQSSSQSQHQDHGHDQPDLQPQGRC